MSANWWGDPYAQYNAGGGGADWAHVPVAAHPLPLTYTDVPYSGALQDFLGGGGGRYGTSPPVNTGPGGPRPSTPSGTILPPSGMVARPTPEQLAGAQVARPTAEQLQGGHTMVAPPMGSGMATGAMAANPTPGYGAPQSGGGVSGMGGATVYGDPTTYARTFMQQHGFNPYSHTAATDSMYKLLAKALPAIFDLTTGGGSMAMDQLADPSAMLNNIFFAGPGSAYGKMADFGRSGFDAMKGMMGGMTPDEQAQLITASSGLQSAGMNPFQQAAVKGNLEQQLGGYQDYIMNNRVNPAQASTKLWDYLINAGLDPFAYLRGK
jgi:hypothetical protein